MTDMNSRSSVAMRLRALSPVGVHRSCCGEEQEASTWHRDARGGSRFSTTGLGVVVNG